MTDLTGKRAIVSGATRGIGRGTAIELASAGAEVVVNYRVAEDSEDASEVVACCLQAGGKAHKVQADFQRQSEIEALVDQSVELMGGVDIVVSNAVYSDRNLFIEQDFDEFRKTIDVGMMGAYYFVRAGATKMVQAGNGGSMVVIGSLHSFTAIPGSMAYNMAKAANNQMAKTAAVELAQHRIRVNLIHPGWIDTPGERKFFNEETLQAEGAKLPWGRLGTPQDIGRGVVYLCDPNSDYITGSVLTIDGGISLPWREMYRLQEKA
ncbi:MAG: SDR family oxidoreductase [Pirellulaceae bacterium]|nr:SDR family oxidoreductase [Pirellulaceae bacterium]